MNRNKDLFVAQYEDNFLLRDLGSVVQRPDIALTELVANAYDAGASKVDIIIPDEIGNLLTVSDEAYSDTHNNKRRRFYLSLCCYWFLMWVSRLTFD
ncbi:MAG: hypothetical protein QM504_17005 [Pseudomonadota bacterium]